MEKNVLILGASGRFGRHAAQSFKTAGWSVHTFDRSKDQLSDAAKGMQVIVAAGNPLYPDWASQLPAMHAQIRAAALKHDALVVLPGNVYVFGADTPLPWGAKTPHKAQNPLGRLRIDMEAAYRREGVRTLLIRAGDFLDTQASGNWFDQILTKRLNAGKLTYPGDLNTPHSWAYLPDLARATVALSETRDTLPKFVDVPFAGYTMTGTEMAQILGRTQGGTITARSMAWWPLRLASPFMPLFKYLREMRYLWDTPHHLDPEPLQTLLPDFEPTPVDQALARATAHLGQKGADQLVPT